LACVGDPPIVSNGGSDGGISDAAPDTTQAQEGGNSDSSSSDATSDSADAGCGDTKTDPNNCGACGHPCSANAGGCFAGVCGNLPIQIASAPLGFHTCALLASGHVYCWGANGHGQLGNGDAARVNQNHAVLVAQDTLGAAFDNVVEITVGGSYDPSVSPPYEGHTCARKTDGSIWCWGNSKDGELGDNTALDWTGDGGPSLDGVLAPQQVPGLSGFVAVRAGGLHTCAIDAAHNVWCWGSNDYGSLGHALNTSGDKNCLFSLSCPTAQANSNGGYYCCNANPKQDMSVSNVSALSVGENVVCVVDSSNVRCWGRHDVYNQLAEGWDGGGPNFTSAPVAIAVAADHVVAGQNFECAYQTGSPLQCWGKNDEGTLGTGDFTSVEGIVNWGGSAGVIPVSVALGAFHACVADQSGRALCSGSNTWGTLGNGTPPAPCIGPNPPCVNKPATVLSQGAPLGDVVEVAVGMQHSCARTADGSIYCWGDNSVSQLGDGTKNANATSAVRVTGLP
jgi:alpha-tubulin suppressor-like RCC1 family protein